MSPNLRYSSLLAILTAFLAGVLMSLTCFAQDTEEATDVLKLSDFRPKAMLKVKTTALTACRFPSIDVHTHFGFRLKGDREALQKFVNTMDEHRIALCTSLDAKLGNEEDHLNFLWKDHKDRFLVFAHIDFIGKGNRDDPKTWDSNQSGFVRTVCENLKVAKQNGILGVKFFKQFGLGFRDRNGSLTQIDDPRFDPIWKTCGELGLPIIIHTGDPAAFFEPIDANNERYEELSRHPDWSFHGDDFPSRTSLLDARNRVIRKHPGTIFIGAHMAGNPEDLATVGKWIDELPNLYVEIASRIGELGRQPFTARKFILKYQDRVLFGTDGPWPELRLTYYWRFLETFDENFPYSEKTPPPQGFWNIYGLGLEEDVLQKIYFRNALTIIPSANEKYLKAAKALGK